MRIYLFPFAAVLALAIAFPSRAAEKPGATSGNQNQPNKVWSNDDMDKLRARGLISIVGPEVQAAPKQTATAPPEPVPPIYSSRLQDPEWYAQKAADLQAELDERAAALREAQTALAEAKDRITQPGVNLGEGNVGITPAAGIAILQAQVGEVESQLDQLSDLARQNGIPQDVLRG